MALNLDTLGLSATVTAQGISAPDYQTILETLTSYFRQIYGSDAYLEPDSKDGQMVALVALAVHDANNTAIEIYNSFSPTTAQAAALSSNVKINGITRKVATNSTADLLLTGTAGTTITNGSARDKNGIIWNFPASVAIGVDGTVLVTATCANSGSVAAMAGTITTIYNENKTNFSKRAINNVIDALKIVIPVMGEPRRSLIPFANGVYDMETGVFSEHSQDNWLTNHNGVTYTPAVPGENLRDHAPNFHKWLSYASDRDAIKMQRIAAALFMVLANRYDWQLFLEITGEGGSGKSVFTHIATMLAGAQNTASGNMAALDSARGRAQFVGKSMITLPDQPKYSGEGTGIKAITGGDAVEIDPKHEHQYTAVLRAVVVATNNTPMIFTERAGGVSRRRVIFQFNRRVSEEDKDPDLAEKISAEIPVVVRRLLATFSDPEKARALLLEQRNSEEALEVKQKTDPLYAFCAHLERLADCVGMLVGNRNPPHRPRIYLYHAYLTFLEANGFEKPLTLNKFSEGMESAMREFNHEYRKERKTRGVVTNVELSESAEDWLPQAHPLAEEKR